MRKLLLALLLSASSLAQAQVSTAPPLLNYRGTTLPTNCVIGRLFFKTDATAGNQIYTCSAANTWTQILGTASGTVTSIGCTTANGVSCTSDGSTTAPRLTFTLGAITPSSVASTGAVSGTTGGFSGMVSVPAGSAGTPGVGIGNSGLYFSASGGDTFFTNAGVYQGRISNTSGWAARTATTIGFESGGAATSADTAISRISAGIIGVGTGAQGSIAGGIQAATGAFGGATIGGNAVAITGTMNVSSTITTGAGMVVAATQYYAFGSTRSYIDSPADASTRFNNAAGTQASILTIPTSATWQLGAADVSSVAVAQKLTFQGNTGASTTGPVATIQGAGGGSGAASVGGDVEIIAGLTSAAAGTSGAIKFKTGALGAGNVGATALTINSAQQAVFADGAVGTPSIRGSDDDSGIYFSGNNTRIATDGFNQWQVDGGGQVQATSNYIAWSNSSQASGTKDTYLMRLGAANVRAGKDPSATPVANILTIGEASRSGTDSNTAGASGTIQSGAGTGNATGSSLLFQTPTATTSGTGAQALATRLTLTEATATFSGAVTGITTLGTSGVITTTAPNLNITPTAATGPGYTQITNTGGAYYFGAENSAGNGFGSGAGAYGMVVYRPASTGFSISRSSTADVTISSAGLIALPNIATDATHTDSAVCQDTTTHALYSGSGTLGVCLGTSSERYKSGLAKLGVGLKQVLALTPVSYFLDAKHGDPNKKLYGFTAEQGGKVLPELMGRDEQGHPNTFDYMGVVPVLTKAIQELEARLRKAESIINRLQRRK